MSEWFNFMTVGKCDFSMWQDIKIFISVGVVGFVWICALTFFENLKRRRRRAKND